MGETLPAKRHNRRMFSRLTQLACWPQAKMMLEQGYGAWAVADWIQKEKREYLDVKQSSLARQLGRYRDEMRFGGALVQSKSVIDRATAAELTTLNELDELGKLILIQKQRIEQDLQLEKKMPKLLKDLRAEIMALADLIDRKVRLEQDVGVRPKTPDTVHHKHAHVIGTLGEILDRLPDEKRAEVRGLIQTAYRNRQLGVANEDSGVPGGGEEHQDGNAGAEVPAAS